jgi:hypothetical protein
MLQGYRQVIDNNKLEISKDGCIVATGMYNPKTRLIQMDNSNGLVNNYSLKDWHVKLGHLGESNLRKTLISQNIPIKGSLSDCEECLLGKFKKLPVPKACNH